MQRLLIYSPDTQGNVIRITDAAGHVTTYTYDARGLLTAETTPNGLVRAYTYNAQGLVEQVVETPPVGSPGAARTMQVAYHATGQVAHVVTTDGIEVRLTYDARSRLVSMHDNLGCVQACTYEAYGNRVSEEVRDAEGEAAVGLAYRYAARARDPEGGALSYRLDAGPEGLQVDASTGVVSWPAPVAGTHAVRIEAVDIRGGVGEQAYTLTVRAQNRAPVFGSAKPPAGVVDAAYRYQIPVTDADEDPVKVRLVEGPLGLVVTDGEVRWTRPRGSGPTARRSPGSMRWCLG